MRRTSLIIGLGGLAPLAIFAAMTMAGQLRQQGERDVAEALSAAREINATADGLLAADASALAVLSTSPLVKARDWPGALGRSREVMRSHPEWTDTIAADERRLIFSTASGVGDRPAPPDVIAFLRSGRDAAFGDVLANGPGCPCLSVYRRAEDIPAGDVAFVARIRLDPFQAILLKGIRNGRMSPTSVSAMVDRRGFFIARTLDFARRRATPATPYLRRAVARGGSGSYFSVTWEGTRTRTTYATSAVTGYSTHIAMPQRRFNLLGAGSTGLTVAAIVLAILVALAAMRAAWLEQVRWRREQAQAIQGQKMEALGRLAGSVAHDFNNILQVILGTTEKLAASIADAPGQRRLALLRQAGEQGAALTQQLLQFARAKPIVLETVDLPALLAENEALIARTVGDAIRVEIAAEAGLPAVRTNRAGLEIALLNLAANARDAMPDGGTLRIAAAAARRGECCELTVSDDGEGMPADVAARALDPFFTTKAEGKGTGLGLAQVHALVLQSEGALRIESEPGAGTTIALTFPQA